MSNTVDEESGMRPKQCDICECSLLGRAYVDGVTLLGPWANMCLECHRTCGCGLGTGFGQRYEPALEFAPAARRAKQIAQKGRRVSKKRASP